MSDNRTIELMRKLLDEYGIEYAESQDRFRTRFRFNYCETCCDYLNEIEVMGACITVSMSYLTPEQAIDATQGSKTCIVIHDLVTHDFRCSNCGKQIGVVRNCEMYETCDGQQAWKSLDHEVCDIPNFCQNCGAKVAKL